MPKQARTLLVIQGPSPNKEMKRSLLYLLPLLLLLFVNIGACRTGDTIAQNTTGGANKDNDTMSNRPVGVPIKIKVGSATFTATLVSSPTTTAFKARLPLTISMSELNRNEKFADLPNDLPTNASSPGTIQTGDLMLYGSYTLVLFYETFPTAYSYTKLGRIDNPSGLATALGSGNVTITFEIE